jgi:hypothetical protein
MPWQYNPWNKEKLDMFSIILSCFSFFLSMTYFCLIIVGAEGYCGTCSHSTTHTNLVGLLWMRNRPIAEASSKCVPRIFSGVGVEGVSTNSVEDRGQRERGSGGGSPIVRGSAQSVNE